jgi:hypothetical protein
MQAFLALHPEKYNIDIKCIEGSSSPGVGATLVHIHA